MAMLKQVGFRRASERESIEKQRNIRFFWCAVRWLLGGQGAHKTPQDGHTTLQDAAKTSQDGPKMRPRRHRMAPRCAQDGTRKVNRAMLKQVGSRRASERESIEKTKEKNFLVCRSVAFGRPRRPQDAPRRPHDAPRCVQDVPRWSQDGPDIAQDGGKMPQDTCLDPKYVNMTNNTRFPMVFAGFPLK